jgi:hypothetical protein
LNHQETAKLLAGMATVWKDSTVDDPELQIVMYQSALEDVAYEDARAALQTGRDPESPTGRAQSPSHELA